MPFSPHRGEKGEGFGVPTTWRCGGWEAGRDFRRSYKSGGGGVSAFGQRDEFGFAGDVAEVAGQPVVFGLFDAVF